MRRLRTVTLVTLLAVVGAPDVGSASTVPPVDVQAAPEPPSPDEPLTDPNDPEPGEPAAPDRVPLVPVPSGCTAPDMPDVVFVGRVVARDFRTARFRIEQVRAGDETPFAADGLIDVRYGIDVDYLEEDRPYLVAARQDPVLGVLASSIRESLPDFAGDDVISVTESDVSCPVFEDQVRTLLPDGSPVESGVFAPLQGSGIRMLGAFAIPLGIAFAVVFVLAMLRIAVSGVATGVDRALDRRRS